MGTDVYFTPADILALKYDLSRNYNGAVLIDNPTFKYNCHAYAWHITEGGGQVWMGVSFPGVTPGTSEDIYWNDGSYVEVNESAATKVSYHQTGDHSAIRLNSDWYQSKWGGSVLVKHHPNNVPLIYKPDLAKKYYIRSTATSISGPNISICSTATFTVNPKPINFTWNCSPNLALSSSSGNSATFRKNSNNGSGWISISVNGKDICKKGVYVGTPVVTISGPSSTPNGEYAKYFANTPEGANPTSYQWILNPQNGNNLYGANSNALDIAFYNSGNYQLVCRATNSCGQGEYTVTNVHVYNTSSYSLPYLDSGSNNLTISFNPTTIDQAKSSMQTLGSTKAIQFTLKIKLYDINGVLCKESESTGEDVVFNVSNLKEGVHILYVYDGISKSPETHKIIIKH